MQGDLYRNSYNVFTKPKYKIGKNQKIHILSQISDNKVVSKNIFDITTLISYLLLSCLWLLRITQLSSILSGK